MSGSHKGRSLKERGHESNCSCCMCKSKRGEFFTKEIRQKISKKLEGNQNSKGYKHTKEAKRKIGKANKGKKLSEETKRKISKGHILYWKNKKEIMNWVL